MDWNQILSGLAGASPLAGALGTACYKLWDKLSANEATCAKELADKDKIIENQRLEIQSLNEKRIADIQAMLKPRA